MFTSKNLSLGLLIASGFTTFFSIVFSVCELEAASIFAFIAIAMAILAMLIIKADREKEDLDNHVKICKQKDTNELLKLAKNYHDELTIAISDRASNSIINDCKENFLKCSRDIVANLKNDNQYEEYYKKYLVSKSVADRVEFDNLFANDNDNKTLNKKLSQADVTAVSLVEYLILE